MSLENRTIYLVDIIELGEGRVFLKRVIIGEYRLSDEYNSI